MIFVESLDGQQSPPPYFFPGVSVNACVLAADSACLQAWCDKFLNIGEAHRYRPLIPFVYLGISHYPQMFSVGAEDLGFVTQDEYFFMFPMVHFENIWGFWIPIGLTWGFPFIGVTNGTSAISGQTVIGYPKLVGEIKRASASDRSFRADVAMPGFPEFSRATRQQLMPIIAMRTGTPAPANPTVAGAAAPLPFPWSILDAGLAASTIEDGLLQLLDDIIPGLYTSTALKQIRDGEDPTRACYQSLLSAEWQLKDLAAPISLTRGEVDVFDNASVAIIETLGLAGGTPIPRPPSVTGDPSTAQNHRCETFEAVAAFEMHVDIAFGDLRNLEL